MENCLQKAPGPHLVYTINEPAAGRLQRAEGRRQGKDVVIVSVDGGCEGVADVGKASSPRPASSTR